MSVLQRAFANVSSRSACRQIDAVAAALRKSELALLSPALQLVYGSLSRKLSKRVFFS